MQVAQVGSGMMVLSDKISITFLLYNWWEASESRSLGELNGMDALGIYSQHRFDYIRGNQKRQVAPIM